MRTRSDRRRSEAKELKRRMTLCKSAHGYNDDHDDYIKRKTDIPHSIDSNYWNAYETKSMKNKKDRLKQKSEISKLIEE
jgi:hypothetical protein